MHVAIYARYSSDLQNPLSTEDQIRECKAHAEARGYHVVAVYRDDAISGASLLQRPSARSLLDHAKARRFERVIVEALDRLSRDQEDTAAIYKRLSHAGVAIETLSEGEINELHVGLKGTMNALFLKDMAHKVRRGQKAKVTKGLSAGGVSYGYDVVKEQGDDGEIMRGRRRVNPEKAAIVRRIFALFVAGDSPRAIAHQLNREGVPAPRGGTWSASSINGSRCRAFGILHNEAYLGRVTYGRRTFRKDPETGREIGRLNPRKDWLTAEAPELRIIDDETWRKAQAIKASFAQQPAHKARRPKHLLSGLVRCGVCGGSFTVYGTDRLACSAKRQRGTCDNHRTISFTELERRVLSGLRDQLLHPKAVDAYLKEFRRAAREEAATAARTSQAVRDALADTEARLARLLEALEGGVGIGTIRDRMAALEAKRDELRATLAGIDAPKVVELHPGFADAYRRQIDQLMPALRLDPATAADAMRVIRPMIEAVMVHPMEERGKVRLELRGQMAGILTAATGGAPLPVAVNDCWQRWSGREDSNLRPPAPKAGALPG